MTTSRSGHRHNEAERGGQRHHENDDVFHRPRRPKPETISYLRSLPLDVAVAKEEIAHFLSTEEEFPPTLTAALAALMEVQHELASLACEQHGAESLEVLFQIVCPTSERAARLCLTRMAPYSLFCATHRYGSHVLQTLLESSVNFPDNALEGGGEPNHDSDLALHSEAPEFLTEPIKEELPSLEDCLLKVADELVPHALDLAVHICGSHVLRTLACVLGGVRLVNHPSSPHGRRGKVKPKKKKKQALGTTDEATHASSQVHVEVAMHSRVSVTPQLRQTLVQLTEALTAASSSSNSRPPPDDRPGALQQLCSHASAGPLLMMLLRVLTYSDPNSTNASESSLSSLDHRYLAVPRVEPQFAIDSTAHCLAQRLLCWQPHDDASSPKDEDDDDDDDPPSKQPTVSQVIYGLAGEPRGSHVVETILQLCPDSMYQELLELGDFTHALQEYVEHDVSNFVIQTVLCTVRTPEQAERMLQRVEQSVSYVVDPAHRRRGILWRAVELAAKYKVRQESLIKAIRVGMGKVYPPTQLVAAEEATEEDANDDEQEEAPLRKKKQRQKATALSIQDCVVKLVSLRPPEKDGDRVGVDAAGVRTVYHLLRFAPRLCQDALEGVLDKLSSQELEWLAKDGLGSRCILDGILQGPNDPIFSEAAKSLLNKLSGRWGALAVDRVGHHTVKNLFGRLPTLNDKRQLVSELAQGHHRLSGNSMGRSVMDTCAIREYMEGESAWNDAIHKREKQLQFLEELERKKERGEGKKKRKRKRNRKSAPDAGEADEVETAAKKVSAVETIMNTISVP